MRSPAVAGRFYSDDPAQLGVMIGWCYTHPLGPGKPLSEGDIRRIRAAIVPHAGYICSGMTAAHAYRAIFEDGLPEVYVIVGPDHYGSAQGKTVLCSDDFVTPLGVCKSDREVCTRLSEAFDDDPGAHSREHAVEVQVPFIQRMDPNPRIVAITMGDQSPRAAAELASELGRALEDRDAVVIASTDMSHYISHASARRLDGMVLDRVAAMDVPGMYRTVLDNRISMCGYGPTAVAMLYAKGCCAEMLC